LQQRMESKEIVAALESEKEETSKSLTLQIESLTEELRSTKSLLKESYEKHEECEAKKDALQEERDVLVGDLSKTKAFLADTETERNALLEEQNQFMSSVDMLETRLATVIEERSVFSSELAKYSDEADEAKANIASLSYKLSVESREKSKLFAEFKACAMAAKAAEHVVRSTNNEESESDGSTVEQEPIIQPSASTTGEMTRSMIETIGIMFKTLSDEKVKLCAALTDQTNETKKAKGEIEELNLQNQEIRKESQGYLRDLDLQKETQQELEEKVEQLLTQHVAVEKSYQLATQENVSLREKMVSLREARAAKCLTLEQEMTRVRDAFRFLEREIHTDAASPLIDSVPTDERGLLGDTDMANGEGHGCSRPWHFIPESYYDTFEK